MAILAASKDAAGSSVLTNQWTNGAADNLWLTAGNWSLGIVPTQTTNVLMHGITDADCILPSDTTSAICKSIDFTNYTGDFQKAGASEFDNAWLNVWGSVTGDDTLANAFGISFEFHASGTYTANGFLKGAVECFTTGVTVTAGDSCSLRELSINHNAIFAIAAKTITFSDASDAGSGNGGVTIGTTATVTSTTGKFVFSASGGVIDVSGTGTLPPCEATGGDCLLSGSTGLCASWTQSAGTYAGKLTVTGAFLTTGGTYGYSGGTSIVTVGGTAVGHNTTFIKVNATGGTQINVSDGCVDGGGNTGFGSFPAAAAAGTPWTGRVAGAAKYWHAVAYNGSNLYVAVAGYGSGVMTSADGVTWTEQTPSSLSYWEAIAYGAGLFVAVCSSRGVGGLGVMTSADGVTWTERTTPANQALYGLCYGGGQFVAVAQSGSGNRVITSPDGINWSSQTSAANNAWSSVAYNGSNLYVAVSEGGTDRVMTSPDGVTWTSATAASAVAWRSVTYGNSLWVAVANTGTTSNQIMTSPDGTNWTNRTSPAARGWDSVVWGSTAGGGVFVAVGGNGGTPATDLAMTSPTGVVWTSRTTPSVSEAGWQDVCYGGSKFVAVSDDIAAAAGKQVMTAP